MTARARGSVGHGSVFAARAFAVVLIADRDPSHTSPCRRVRAWAARCRAHRKALTPSGLAGENALLAPMNMLSLIRSMAHGTQPWAGRGDVIGGALAFA